MTEYKYRKGYLAGDKRCVLCGADTDHLRLLNPKGEFQGGVERFYYRCGRCKQYFVEYWLNGELKTLFGS